MSLATALVSVLLAAMLALAAARKLSHRPAVVDSYARVGVAEERLDLLAAVLLAGAAGLLIGLAWAPLGVAAACGLIVYFLVAVAAHIRADDAANLPVPALLEVLAVAALVLQLESL